MRDLRDLEQGGHTPFEDLRDYRAGEIWNRLLQVRPQPASPLMDPLPFEPTEPATGIIYHYTTVSGLRGILQSNCVWASAAYYMNDSSEIEYGCELVRKELSVWRTANDGNNSFAADVLRALDRIFSSPLSRISRTTTTYVTCFCGNDNLLSQWRAYGQAGGYSLGFEVNRERSGLSIPGGFWNLRLAKVVYNTWLQNARINSLLKQALLVLGDFSVDEVSQAKRQNMVVDAVLFIEELLLDEVVTFKNPAFREEKEWRLIVRPNVVRRQGEQLETQKGTDFKFRDQGGALIPYLELRPEHGKLPLRSIRFGPTLESGLTEHSVRMLLLSCGYKGVSVEGSEIPVRL